MQHLNQDCPGICPNNIDRKGWYDSITDGLLQTSWDSLPNKAAITCVTWQTVIYTGIVT